MSTITVRTYARYMSVNTEDVDYRDQVMQSLFPDEIFPAEFSYDPECNTLDFKLDIGPDSNSQLSMVFEPSQLLAILLGVIESSWTGQRTWSAND